MSLNFTVDGGWGDWTAWQSCPVTCGGANQSRIRTCDNPQKTDEGYDCTVDGSTGSDLQICNGNPCPSKSHKDIYTPIVIFNYKPDRLPIIKKSFAKLLYALS